MAQTEMRSFARAPLKSVAWYLGRAYIAGPGMDDALAVYDRVVRDGQAGTIGYFNPGGDSAREIADLNIAVLAALSNERRNGYVSIKAPAMQYDHDLITEIACQSEVGNGGIHFDSHSIDTTDPTFAAIEVALLYASRVGCTLPGRWLRSLADAERAIDMKLRVRVVKGQSPDPARADVDPAKGYIRVINRLAGRARSVAVATHDPLLARSSLTRLLEAGTPCELELLYGYPMRAVSTVARSMSVPIRVYIPFGNAWLPYALTQVINKPTRLWWILKDAFAASVPKTLN